VLTRTRKNTLNGHIPLNNNYYHRNPQLRCTSVCRQWAFPDVVAYSCDTGRIFRRSDWLAWYRNFGGFTIGCFLGPKIIKSVGHARTFAGITALLTATFLAFPLLIDLAFWGILRLLSGACLAVLYIVVESWLNDSTSNVNRGRTLSIYIIVSNVVTMAGQLMVNSFDTLDATLFILVAILICLSIVPISLTPTPAPSPVPSAKLDLKALYRVSPVGVVGCLLAGIVEGAFWTLGPVFAQGRGMETADIALLMAAFVLGGTVSQWPLGWASDRIDRRIVISVTSFGTVITGLIIGFDIVPEGSATFIIAGCHGALMVPIYALCISHANDVVPNERMVETSGGLLLSFSIGATAGPITASTFMRDDQPGGLFIFIGAILCLLGLFVLYRLLTDKNKRLYEKHQYTQTSAASPAIFPNDAE